jgi:hypothetical protein
MRDLQAGHRCMPRGMARGMREVCAMGMPHTVWNGWYRDLLQRRICEVFENILSKNGLALRLISLLAQGPSSTLTV